MSLTQTLCLATVQALFDHPHLCLSKFMQEIRTLTTKRQKDFVTLLTRCSVNDFHPETDFNIFSKWLHADSIAINYLANVHPLSTIKIPIQSMILLLSYIDRIGA